MIAIRSFVLCLGLCASGAALAGDACNWRVMTDAEARTALGWGQAVARAMPQPATSAWCDFSQGHGVYEPKMDYSSGLGDCKKTLPRTGKAVCEATAAGCFPTRKTEVMYRKYRRGANLAAAAKDCAVPGRMDAARESATWTIDTPEKHVAFLEKMSAIQAPTNRLEEALDRQGTLFVTTKLHPHPTACKPDDYSVAEPGVLVKEQLQNAGTEFAVLTQEWCFGANVVPRPAKAPPQALSAGLAPPQSVEIKLQGDPDAVRDLGKRLDRKAILKVVGR